MKTNFEETKQDDFLSLHNLRMLKEATDDKFNRLREVGEILSKLKINEEDKIWEVKPVFCRSMNHRPISSIL
jgi:hypothetical protein